MPYGWKGKSRRVLEFPADPGSPVAPTGRARIRYNHSEARLEGSIEGSAWVPLSAIAGGGVVADLAALSAIDDAAVANGIAMTVATLHDDFDLDKASTETVDGITVVPTASGAGRWLRKGLTSGRWLGQRDFHINADVGDDENDGSDGNQLKTFAEYTRRIGGGRPTPKYPAEPRIFIETDLTEYEFVINGQYSESALFQGTRTVVATGTITANQDWDAATSQEGTITDSALPVSWTDSDLVGKMIVLTTGANAGAIAWIAKDLGSKTTRHSPFVDALAWSPAAVTVGDEYEVVTLTKLNGSLHIEHGVPFGCWLFDLEINPVEYAAMDITATAIFIASTVLFSGGAGAHRWFLGADGHSFIGCRMASPWNLFITSGSVELYGCFLDDSGFGTRYGHRRYEVASPCLMQGASGLRLRDGGMFKMATAAWLAAYDMTAHAVALQRNGMADIQGKVFGTGSSQNGVWMDSSSQMLYPDGDNFTDHFDVTTSGVETRVGGVDKTYAEIGSLGFVNLNGGKIVPSETYQS